MQRRDDREAIGLRQISEIPRRHQRSEGQAEAHGDLLKRAGYFASEKRAALDAWGAFVAGLAGDKAPKKVVRLRKAQ